MLLLLYQWHNPSEVNRTIREEKMESMGEEGANAEQKLIEKTTTPLWSLLSAAKSMGEEDAARLSEIVTTVNEGLGAVMLLAKKRGHNERGIGCCNVVGQETR